ncbi:MAG: PAS domain S-box protein [Cyanobacteria bacterium P01_A01_bin.40]
MNKKFRLRTTLVVPFVLQIVTVVGLVGYFSFRNGRQAVSDLANRLIEEKGNRIEKHVINYLDKSQNTLWLNYAGVESGNFDLQDFVGLRRYFWQVVHQGTYEGYLSYGNEQGEFVGVEYRDNGDVQLKIRTDKTSPLRETYLFDKQGNPEELLKISAYDPRTRPWYQAAKQAGKPTWSDIYPFFSSKNTILGISPVYPIYNNDGKLLGVLCINVRLTRITDFINNLDISPNGQSFIIERSGDLVASSTIERPFKIIGSEADRKIERISPANSKEPIVNATAQHIIERFGGFNSVENQQLQFQIDGEKYYARVIPINDGRGIDWLTVVVVPERDFMAQINRNNRNSVFLCSAALLGAIAIGFYTSGLITHPIEKVSNASDELARGELNRQVKASPIVEVDTLANSFNSMAQQLKSTFDTLQESESRFRGLVDNIPGAIYRCQYDADWTMTYISDSIETISGYCASELIENQVRTYTSIIHLEDRDLVEDTIQQAISKQEPYMVDYRIIHRDSSIHWVYERGQAIFDCQGNTLFLDGVIFDISERKRAEEALRITEENYRSIFENALEGIFQSSPQGYYKSVNPALAKIYGYESPAEMIESITDIGAQVYVDPQRRTEFRELLAKDGKVKNFEYRCYCKDKSIIWTEIDARVVKDNSGNVLYYEGIVQDITERKQCETELRKQLKELKIEIDQNKREKDVAMLTSSSLFQEVQEEVAEVDLDEFWS